MTDYTNISKMPLWPKQMACDKVNARFGYASWRPCSVPGNALLTELALMCWQFCEEPVDPDTLIAREAMARTLEDNPDLAAAYRVGVYDEGLKASSAYLAARLAREQGAK